MQPKEEVKVSAHIVKIQETKEKILNILKGTKDKLKVYAEQSKAVRIIFNLRNLSVCFQKMKIFFRQIN